MGIHDTFKTLDHVQNVEHCIISFDCSLILHTFSRFGFWLFWANLSHHFADFSIIYIHDYYSVDAIIIVDDGVVISDIDNQIILIVDILIISYHTIKFMMISTNIYFVLRVRAWILLSDQQENNYHIVISPNHQHYLISY